MTVRVYLQAARLVAGPTQTGDLPAERVFIHASDVPEFWVETESANVPPPGRAVAFTLLRGPDIGFQRVEGTVERRLDKKTKERLGET